MAGEKEEPRPCWSIQVEIDEKENESGQETEDEKKKRIIEHLRMIKADKERECRSNEREIERLKVCGI